MEISPTNKKRIIALREAGFTIGVIAQKVGVSPRSIDRVCREFGAKKGRLSREAVEKAKADLLNDSDFVNEIKLGLRIIALDSIAQVISLRNRVASTLDSINSHDLESAALAARSLAALATAIRVSSDSVRALDGAVKESEELPEIKIGVMSEAEIERIRRKNFGENYDDIAGDEKSLDDLLNDD